MKTHGYSHTYFLIRITHRLYFLNVPNQTKPDPHRIPSFSSYDVNGVISIQYTHQNGINIMHPSYLSYLYLFTIHLCPCGSNNAKYIIYAKLVFGRLSLQYHIKDILFAIIKMRKMFIKMSHFVSCDIYLG